MTVSSTTVKNSYSGNGSTTQFAYGFKIFADSDLIVIIRSSTGTETVKTLTTHYTVAGAGDASGGSITFTTGNTPASGETVVIIREVPQTQAIDYIANDPFPAESHEEGLDRATMTTQQVQEEVDRSLKLSRTNTMTSTEFTVGATDRANKVLSFDSSGELSVTQELGTFRGNWSASTAYQVRDLVKDTSTNNIFMANTAHTSSGSQPLTSNTDSAKWDLIVDAATATTSSTSAANSATAAANSATASANSATASANSASAASTSETNAASSASTASTQATNSANSATASANSASAAEATFDLFDDSFLGAKSSDPTVDNDGNALKDGALYFDTTNDVMKVYNLSTTTWLQLTPTVTNQNNINSAVANASNINAAVANASNINAAVANASNINSAVSNASNINTVAGIASNVTSVANNETNINSVNSNSSNINTVAGSITNVNNVGGSIANVNTTAANITGVNSFADRYRVASSAPTTSLDSGDLYFDTSTNILNVYGASGWQNAGSSVNGTSDRFKFVASGTPTTFSGSDANGNTLAYDAGFIDVYLNGIKMVNGTDVTVTSGSSIVFASALTNGDIVEAVAFGTFAVASLTNTTVTGSLSFPDGIKAKFGTGNDLEIYHDGSHSRIDDTGTGDLIIRGNDQVLIEKYTGETLIQCNADAGIGLYHNDVRKFETTSGGATVTGNFIATGDISTGNNGVLNILDGDGDISGKLANQSSSSHSLEIIADPSNSGANSNMMFKIDNSEKARFDTSGNFFVATTTEASDDVGHALLANGAAYHTADGTYAGLFNRKSSNGEVVQIRKDNTVVGKIGIESTGFTVDGEANHSGVRFSSASFLPRKNYSDADGTVDLGTTDGRWKDIYLGGGAFLGGTGSANFLDDFEKGTFTPTFSHGISSIGYANQAGRYTKVGDIVYFDLNIQTNAGSGANTRLRISGFPFTANGSGAGNASIGFTDNALINSTTTNLPTLFKEPSTLDFYNSGGGQMVGTDLNNPASINIYISGVYKTT